jgi:hypothetical protein
VTTPNDSQKSRPDLQQALPPVVEEADSETQATLPSQASSANFGSEPPLPDYFLAGVIATGFSAACVAVGTSFFGLQGTFVGGVVGAMAGSIASQVSKHRLLRVEHRTRVLMRKLAEVRGNDVPRWAAASPATLAGLKARIPWRAIASASLIAVVGFGVGAAGLSAVELLGGRPVSSLTSGEPATGTTFQRIVETAVPAETPRQERAAERQAIPVASPTAAEPVGVPAPAASAVAATPAVEAGAPDFAESPEPSAAGVASPQPALTETVAASPSATITVTTTPSPRPTESAATPTASPGRTATPSSVPTVAPSATP